MSAYAVSARGLASRRVPQGVLAPMNELLFGSGEQGAWYDPSDLSTLFQDSAGTTPVTAVEQPVGLMLDKSGRGNHAIQATSTKRPKYSRRVNLLTKTRGSPLLSNYTTTDNVIPPPTGVSTSTQIVATAAPATPVVISTATSTSMVVSCYFHTTSTETVRTILLRNATISNNLATVAVNLTTGAKTDGGVNSTVTYAGGGWYKLQINQSVGISVGDVLYLYLGRGATEAPGVTWNIAGPSLVPAGSETLPHQWSDSSSSYDADPNKFPAYLACDGIDDAMATIGNVDLSSAQQLAAVSGYCVTKGTGTSLLAELTSVSITAGAFSLFVRQVDGVCAWSIAAPQMLPSSAARPLAENTVNAVCFDRGGASTAAVFKTLRLNGEDITPAFPFSSQTPTFANAQLFLFARNNGTTHFMGGRFYGLLVRGGQSSPSQIEAVETLIRKTMRLP